MGQKQQTVMCFMGRFLIKIACVAILLTSCTPTHRSNDDPRIGKLVVYRNEADEKSVCYVKGVGLPYRIDFDQNKWDPLCLLEGSMVETYNFMTHDGANQAAFTVSPLGGCIDNELVVLADYTDGINKRLGGSFKSVGMAEQSGSYSNTLICFLESPDFPGETLITWATFGIKTVVFGTFKGKKIFGDDGVKQLIAGYREHYDILVNSDEVAGF